MIIVYICLLLISLAGVKIKLKGFNTEYLSRDTTLSIKGFFTVLVFCRHFKQYVALGENLLDRWFLNIDGYLGQLIVVMFLFYSGYGIFIQIKRSSKGEYINTFLRHRFLPTWLNFAVCICLFLIINILLGTIGDYSWWQIMLSFIGWTSIGNSNWFMFDTFVLYILIFMSFRLFHFTDVSSFGNILLFSAMTVVLAMVLVFTKNSTWWNTILCFPLGMWYGFFHEKIEAVLRKQTAYWITVISMIFILGAIYFHDSIITYMLVSALFAFIIVLLSMKINIDNPILRFLGRHVFSIYILQRIPFMILKNRIENVYLYFVISFIFTLVIAVLFDKAFGRVKSMILRHGIGESAGIK